MNHWIHLLRPQQWYKNLLVFVPLVFSENLSSAAAWPNAALTFGGFCLLASSVYVANDLLDKKRDQAHPRKRERPIASGAISTTQAVGASLVLLVLAFLLLSLVGRDVEVIGTLYLGVQVLYNLALKHVALWDALSIAFGFVLRALAGTVAIDVGNPTVWLIMCSFLLAFYLALSKRRHELELEIDPKNTRPILSQYSVPFLEQTMQASMALLLAAYTMYTVFGPDQWMMFTIPFAFYGVLRHNLLVHQRNSSEQAELIFRDRATMANGLLWFGVVLLVQAGWLQSAYSWVIHAS